MFTKESLLILLTIQVVFVLVSAQSNFTNIPICSAKDSNVDDCLKKTFDELIPRAANGFPELNIPPMDPFAIDKLNFALSADIVKGKLGLRNVSLHGLINTQTKSVTYKRNGNQATLAVDAFLPKLFLEGIFMAKIRFNAAKITSKGPFNITLTDIHLMAQPEAELYERDGHTYMRLLKYDFTTSLGNLRFSGDGIMPDPLLNEAVIEFLNQNWKSLYQVIIAETRAAWEPAFVKVGNAYFSRVPLDAILRDDYVETA